MNVGLFCGFNYLLISYAFGEGFRRPLTLMRAFMADCAGAANAAISIAPCCCARATQAELAVVSALARR